MSHKLVYITYPDAASARKAAKTILERKLAACINILPKISSLYLWKGKVQEEEEVVMIVKTTLDQIQKLKKLVEKKHPHEVPCCVVIDISDGHKPFLDWISESVQ